MSEIIEIDAGLSLEFLFSGPLKFIKGPSRIGRTDIESFTGRIHSYGNFIFDQFSIDVYHLTEAQQVIIQKLVEQSGSSITHTLKYTTSGVIRLYDGTTSPSGIINKDVGRIRNKVLMESDGIIHHDYLQNDYFTTLNFVET